MSRSVDTAVVHLPFEIAALVESQLGLATRAQLIDGGLTKGQLRWAVGRHWRTVLPRVLLLSTALPTDEQRLVAALLFAGPDAWLAGPTAAAVNRLPGCALTSPIHVLVPPHRSTRSVAWVTVSRSYLAERVVERGPLRLSGRARALVDAAADCPTDDQARALFIDAVQHRFVRLDDVAHWVESRESAGRRRLRAALAEAAAGAWSLPEAELLHLLRRSRVLPPPWPNPTLVDHAGAHLTTPDVWYDDVAMAVMVHSRRFHAGVLDWEKTVTGDGDLEDNGVLVVGVTPKGLNRDPDGVLRRVERAYQRAADWPRDRVVRATPKTWGLPASS